MNDFGVLSVSQQGALREADMRGYVKTKFGFHHSTLRSLEDRGFLRSSLTNPDRWTLTQKGHDFLNVEEVV